MLSRGASHEEASQRLGWPIGTLKSRLARGRLLLQERLLRRGIAPFVAITAGTGLLGIEASAAVPPALIESTTRAAAAVAAGSALTGVIPAALSGLVQEELGSMFATKMKLVVVGALTVAASVVAIGFVVAAAPGQQPKPALVRQQMSAEAPKLAAKLSASGRVIDSDGKPIAAAGDFSANGQYFASEECLRGSPRGSCEAKLSTTSCPRSRLTNRADFNSRTCPRRLSQKSPRRAGASFPGISSPSLKVTASPGCRSRFRISGRRSRLALRRNSAWPTRRAGRETGGRGEGQGLRHRPAREAG